MDHNLVFAPAARSVSLPSSFFLQGNVLRLHQRAPLPAANETTAPPTSSLDSRGGRLPNLSSAVGLGIAYAHFRVRPGTAAGLARFYREILGAYVEEVGSGKSADEATCSMVSVRYQTRVDERLWAAYTAAATA